MKIGNIEVYGVIYKITNTINNKIYIGQTVVGYRKRYKAKGSGIERIYYHNIHYKNNNRYYNDHLIRSIEKYGFNAFEVIEIYDIAFSKEELDIKEKHYIQQFNCINNGYNHTEGGSGVRLFGENNSFYGKRHTKESRDKISKNHADVSGENNPRAEKVICITTGKIFNTIKEASEYYDISRSSITACCIGYKMSRGEKKIIKSAGKLSDGTKLVWKYLKDYNINN